MSTYLLIGLALGVFRALCEVSDYLHGWYQRRKIVHFGASVDEFAWLFFWSLLGALLIMFIWPLWLWHKFTEHWREA